MGLDWAPTNHRNPVWIELQVPQPAERPEVECA